MGDDRLLYERTADRVEEWIASGVLRPGERLPSVRRLSRQLEVSVATAVQAYQLLEARGVVETRPQSGHYVRPPPSATLPEPRIPRVAAAPIRPDVSERVARVYGALRDPKVIPFGAAVPSPEILPVDKLASIVSQLARKQGATSVAYDPPPGALALRRQLARRSIEWGCPLGADDFVTTVGAMEALHLCLVAVTRPGDSIAIESPAYYGLLQLIERLGLRAVEIPSHPRDGLDLDALARALQERKIAACLSVPNFSNPLGCLASPDRKRALVTLLAKHDVPLVEDDIYGDLHFGPERPPPAKAFDRKGGVLLVGSFSKTVAPGYRVGFVAPGRWREKIERLKFAHSVATSTLPQLAVAEFLAHGGYERHLRKLRRTLQDQVERTSAAVCRLFPPGTRLSRPQGGFVLWVELPRGTSALAVQERALEAGISVAPGPIFSARGRFEHCLRLNCGHPWTDAHERAVATLGRLAHELRGSDSARG